MTPSGRTRGTPKQEPLRSNSTQTIQLLRSAGDLLLPKNAHVPIARICISLVSMYEASALPSCPPPRADRLRVGGHEDMEPGWVH
jgi:hypothetical protein